jgi:hypothetical protein
MRLRWVRHGKGDKYTEFQVEDMKGRGHSEDQGVDGRKIRKLLLKI